MCGKILRTPENVIDFEHLYKDFENMLPGMKQTFENLKIDKIRMNKNAKNPITSKFVQENLQALKPQIYKRLCNLYEKDFIVFGYTLPSFDQIKNGTIF